MAVVVLHYGDRSLTERCVESVDGPVFVVDNQGDWPDPDYRPERNLGFAAGCNAAAERTEGDLIFFNNDAYGDPSPLLKHFEDERVGIVGCRIVSVDGTLQHAGTRLFFNPQGILTAENITSEEPSRYVDVVTGACMAVRRECFEQLEGFDEGFWNGYEDVDFCLRARSEGWRVWYDADVTVTHVGAASGAERWAKVSDNITRLHQRWAHKSKV